VAVDTSGLVVTWMNISVLHNSEGYHHLSNSCSRKTVHVACYSAGAGMFAPGSGRTMFLNSCVAKAH
jgi:hypothetical protein